MQRALHGANDEPWKTSLLPQRSHAQHCSTLEALLIVGVAVLQDQLRLMNFEMLLLRSLAEESELCFLSVNDLS